MITACSQDVSMCVTVCVCVSRCFFLIHADLLVSHSASWSSGGGRMHRRADSIGESVLFVLWLSVTPTSQSRGPPCTALLPLLNSPKIWVCQFIFCYIALRTLDLTSWVQFLQGYRKFLDLISTQSYWSTYWFFFVRVNWLIENSNSFRHTTKIFLQTKILELQMTISRSNKNYFTINSHPKFLNPWNLTK